MNYHEIFSLRADKYIQAGRKFPYVRDKELSEFCSLLDLRAGEILLDAPSGDSVLNSYIGKEIFYHGLDPSPDFYAAGKEKGLEVHPNRLSDSPFSADYFDVIGSLTGLHHEAVRRDIYVEWHRILKPGGRVIIMDVGSGSDVATFLDGFVDTWSSRGHQGTYLDAQDVALLDSVGFSNLKVGEHKYDWIGNSVEEIATFMRDLFGLDLDPDEQQLKEAIVRQLGCRHVGPMVHVSWCLTSIIATK